MENQPGFKSKTGPGAVCRRDGNLHRRAFWNLQYDDLCGKRFRNRRGRPHRPDQRCGCDLLCPVSAFLGLLCQRDSHGGYGSGAGGRRRDDDFPHLRKSTGKTLPKRFRLSSPVCLWRYATAFPTVSPLDSFPIALSGSAAGRRERFTRSSGRLRSCLSLTSFCWQ